MVCTKCGKEMRKGYLFASKDGAFSFANEVPGVFEKADKADGFVIHYMILYIDNKTYFTFWTKQRKMF